MTYEQVQNALKAPITLWWGTEGIQVGEEGKVWPVSRIQYTAPTIYQVNGGAGGGGYGVCSCCQSTRYVLTPECYWRYRHAL